MLPKISEKTLRLQNGHKTRAEHLTMIRVTARKEGYGAAQLYWLRECPRISRAAFEKAVNP